MRFRKEYFFLSNFYTCPVTVEIEGKVYTFKNSEAAFQAHKCPAMAGEFVNLDGFNAKRLGSRVPLRPDWNDIRIDIMKKVIAAKFTNPDLKRKLLAVTDPIVEDNTHGDTFWGRCAGQGLNHLGIIITECRQDILNEEQR